MRKENLEQSVHSLDVIWSSIFLAVPSVFGIRLSVINEHTHKHNANISIVICEQPKLRPAQGKHMSNVA